MAFTGILSKLTQSIYFLFLNSFIFYFLKKGSLAMSLNDCSENFADLKYLKKKFKNFID